MSYNYPPTKYNIEPIYVKSEEHTMGHSLLKYLDLKIHPLLLKEDIKKIEVVGVFNRNEGVSPNEKAGKLFNYIRPTAVLQGETLQICCFPGWDYVFHFANIIASFFYNKEAQISISCSLPSDENCWQPFFSSSIQQIPDADIAILGYVEFLDHLSEDQQWRGGPFFFWKNCYLKSKRALLIGCKHTYWGEIAGRITELLASKGIEIVIYSGKLGTLDPDYVPNQCLATGSRSNLPNGTIISWDNLFERLDDTLIKIGDHITVPSVLQETSIWKQQVAEGIKFVDPEIGHMAVAAAKSGIRFSYLHVVSDNLAKKFDFDLSNERHQQVLNDRKKLYKIIGDYISKID